MAARRKTGPNGKFKGRDCPFYQENKKITAPNGRSGGSGGYQNVLVDALHHAGLPVHVANPRQIRDFARSLNRLGKTDALDALTIAEFAHSRKLPAQKAKPEALRDISNLLRRREQLQGMLLAEKNHLEQTPLPLQSEILELIKIIRCRVANLEKQIKTLIEKHENLSRMNAIIQSIPGVGPIMAATLIADLPEIMTFGRKQIAALVGLAPFNRDSGKYRGQRHIFAGRARVRKTLYCVLRPCLQFNSIIRKWFERFLANGKHYKVAAIACCRKLLVVIRAMLISNTYWNPDLHQLG